MVKTLYSILHRSLDLTVEFLLNFRNKKDNINLKIEGIISIIGSLLTIISSILSIMTFK